MLVWLLLPRHDAGMCGTVCGDAATATAVAIGRCHPIADTPVVGTCSYRLSFPSFNVCARVLFLFSSVAFSFLFPSVGQPATGYDQPKYGALPYFVEYRVWLTLVLFLVSACVCLYRVNRFFWRFEFYFLPWFIPYTPHHRLVSYFIPC